MYFPVPGGKFSNDWSAPRIGHLHQGNDIFAPMRTPVYAPVSGVVQFGAGKLSGNYARVVGTNGDRYFMGHLSGFAGTKGYVSAGQVIGYVGNTGNAKGGPPHVHFEYHPGGGKAVNPYPYLRGAQQVRSSGNNQYWDLVISAANKHGVPPEILLGLVRWESNFNPNDVNPKSGCTGLGQFALGTWLSSGNPYKHGDNRKDPTANAFASAWYLRTLYDRYGSWEKALSYYTGFAGNVNNFHVRRILKAAQEYAKMGLDYSGSSLTDNQQEQIEEPKKSEFNLAWEDFGVVPKPEYEKRELMEDRFGIPGDAW